MNRRYRCPVFIWLVLVIKIDPLERPNATVEDAVEPDQSEQKDPAAPPDGTQRPNDELSEGRLDTPQSFRSWSIGQVGGVGYGGGLPSAGREDAERQEGGGEHETYGREQGEEREGEASLPQLEVVHEGDEEEDADDGDDEASSGGDVDGHGLDVGSDNVSAQLHGLRVNASRLVVPAPTSASRAAGGSNGRNNGNAGDHGGEQDGGVDADQKEEQLGVRIGSARIPSPHGNPLSCDEFIVKR